MAELTSTNVYGKLNVTRELQVTPQHSLSDSIDRPGLLMLEELQDVAWSGLQIKRNGGKLWSFFGNDTQMGLYDDENSDWILQYDEDGGVGLYYNAVSKLETTATGIEVTGKGEYYLNAALSEVVGAEDLYYVGASAPGDDHGIAMYSQAFGGNDYQYVYYRETNDYGGFFHRQGTSFSDLRQDYNYLRWYYGTTGGVDEQVMGLSSSAVVFNESSNDIDFRVESNTNEYAIFVDAANSFMGMNLSTPNCTLNLGGSFRIDDSAERPNAGTGLEFYFDNSTGYIHPYDRTGAHYAGSGMDIRGTNVILRAVDGAATRQNLIVGYDEVVINEDAADVDFRVEALAPNDYAFYVRGSDAKVGMGEMTTETEATYKMLNLRFYEANSAAKLTSVGAVSSNDGMLIYNDYTTTGHASIDFVVDTNYPTTYNAGRFGWYGYGTTSTSTSYNYFFWTGYSGAANWETMRLHRLGDLYVRSDVVAYSTVITSDERLKKNIENLEESTLDKLLKLRPVTFEWKDESKRGGERVAGLIAQEVETIFPELISENPNLGNGLDEEQDETEYKHVRYNELIPYLTKGMQEQQKIIEDQQAEIDTLKEQMAAVLEKLK